MACVTLKRPLQLDFDSSPIHSRGGPPSSKRRRCVPIDQSAAAKHRRLDSRDPSPSSPFMMGLPAPSPSAFHESVLTPGEIAENLRDELKRIKRRRQFAPMHARPSCSSAALAPGSPGRSSPPSSPEPMSSSSAHKPAAAAAASPHKEKPIFTMRQMTIICERMCKERTDKVREEYEQILQQKLSEQYDAFVKFIDHQIQERFNQAQLPSYLS